MKTISIRELHEKTGEWVRQAAHFGQIEITDRGRVIARLIPQEERSGPPSFANRKLTPKLKAILNGAGRGTDATQIVSEERDDR